MEEAQDSVRNIDATVRIDKNLPIIKTKKKVAKVELKYDYTIKRIPKT